MSDSSQTPWKVITGIAVVAAVALGFLWMQARSGTVPVSTADSLRQANQQLSSQVQKLRAMPPETVYAQPPAAQRTDMKMAERIRAELADLEAVLPPVTSPNWKSYQKIRAIRTARDSLAGGSGG
ncbi:MAG: hypothetical protein ABEJ46_01560 [Gemmatimonadota bacterium]